MKREIRTFSVETRSEEGRPRVISGYAAVFGQPSEDMGGWREIIAPGAFDGVIDDDCRCLVNHEMSQVLGRTAAKTLTLSVDARGLKFECGLPDTQYARDLSASMDRGDIDQCSFAFSVAADGCKWEDRSGQIIRTINKFSRLYDVSVVTIPAYPQTTADIRSNAEILSERPVPVESAGIGVDLLRRRFALLTK